MLLQVFCPSDSPQQNMGSSHLLGLSHASFLLFLFFFIKEREHILLLFQQWEC
jgi:hypothetical protein